jgi:antitoxin (DNA-binding transcriptional repressor) of toxin-antitoxin stability system
MCHNQAVKKVNMRQLRETKRLKAWLRSGQTVELCERNRPIARIVPINHHRKATPWPDFAAIRKEIIGDRVLPGSDLVIEERGRY